MEKLKIYEDVLLSKKKKDILLVIFKRLEIIEEIKI